MRHRKSGRHIGRHRAPIAPRARYAAVVTTAVVGAGVVALGAGSALPTPQTDQANAALDRTSALSSQDNAAARADRANTASRASRAQRRAGAPTPQKMPEWVRPAVGPLSSLFAARWGTFHYGVDIAAPYGSTVRAASAGRVIKADWYGGYGKVVIIDHGNGLTSRYGHNSELLVKPGDYVQAGQPIAKVGSTGYSTGPHCHFELRLNDKPFDPMPWMRDHGIDLGKVDTGL